MRVLVRVVQGEMWDVAVDVRPGSFGRVVSTTHSSENFRQLYIAPACGRAWVAYDDPALAIR